MATLTEGEKLFIVQALACYDTPTQVAEAVREEFGKVVERTQVAQYDPTKAAGVSLSKKWRIIFQETRKRFREEVAEIPIANRAFRLRALARMATKAETMRNIALAVQVIEQAAKEVGDVFVNRTAGGRNGPDDPASPTEVHIGTKDAKKHDDD